MAPITPERRGYEFPAVDANNNGVASNSILAVKWTLLGYIQRHYGFGSLARAAYYQALFRHGYKPPFGYIDQQLSTEQFNQLLSTFEDIYLS